MTIFQSIVYGLVQGLTEFLPVSSSAHLVLIPVFTGWADPGLAFDVALHWGTLIAALFYFRDSLVEMVYGLRGFLNGYREPANLLPLKIIAATVPGAVMGLALEEYAETVFRSPSLLVVTLSVMGALLFIADRLSKKSVSLSDLTWAQAFIIGFSQGIALVPGVSRSGVTITTALFLGLDRSSAVRFSFLLSIPITFGAGLLKSPYLLENINNPVVWSGLVSSCLSGFAAITILIRYVRTKSFAPFVIYRFALALVVLYFITLK